MLPRSALGSRALASRGRTPRALALSAPARRPSRGVPLYLLCLLLALASCAIPAPTDSAPTPQSAVTTCDGSLCAASGVSVFIEPDAGETPILDAITGAATSVWVEVYEITDNNVINALEAAAHRGVDVRVMLDPRPFGGVSSQQLVATLSAAGVKAEASSPAYRYTHEKMILVDGSTLYVLTANLSRAALGGNGSTKNREYGVIDRDTKDIAEVQAIFQDDWARTTPPATTYAQAQLVVSPVNARATLAALIAGAKKTLHVEDEEMVDATSEATLIAAAKRGVEVEVVLPKPASAASDDPDVPNLLAGGVHVRFITSPYMHAKLVVADGTLAFTGSENFSATSLDKNRELGIVIDDAQALATFEHVFGLDWSSATDAS
jgi:phosphatidylserine/phosphatidylglycerophosphate/cardiolipin synthase-like enzyme